MSDWESYENIDPVNMAAAGNCFITPGTMDDTYVEPIVKAVEEEKISRQRLEKNIYYLLRVVLKRHKKIGFKG